MRVVFEYPDGLSGGEQLTVEEVDVRGETVTIQYEAVRPSIGERDLADARRHLVECADKLYSLCTTRNQPGWDDGRGQMTLAMSAYESARRRVRTLSGENRA